MVEHLNDGMSASRNSNIAPGSRLNHVLDVKRVIALEQAIAADGTSLSSLMERAGCALADEVRARLPRPACVAVLAGSGNNGGDGWVCARALAEAGWPVTLVSPMEADEIAAEPARSAALEAKARAKQLDLPLSLLIAPSPEELAEQLSGAHVVVDAILGTGFSGMQVREPYATWIELANVRCFPTDLEPSRGHAAEADAGGKAQGAAIMIAADAPSGLSAQTGEAALPCIRADVTVTMLVLKPGLLAPEAARMTGRVKLAPLVDDVDRFIDVIA